MPSVAKILVHPSQSPENLRRQRRQALERRQINHKFHYDSPEQAEKWLALHQAYSPCRTDSDCAAVYDRAFAAAAARLTSLRLHLIGLGCGAGQKDLRLLRLLQPAIPTAQSAIHYTPCDVSASLVLTACQAAAQAIPEANCHPVVCDLAEADDLPQLLAAQAEPTARRLLAFFGMLPNFEPALILPRLAALMNPADLLLLSANLAPGPDYAAGLRRILPLYDNALTRDWLLTFLFDLGMAPADGELRFAIEDAAGLKRITADFYFKRARTLEVDDAAFAFQAGDKIRLFFSYRHTPRLVRDLLKKYNLKVLDQWIASSEEEGVFLITNCE